jgi:hypothetical protein
MKTPFHRSLSARKLTMSTPPRITLTKRSASQLARPHRVGKPVIRTNAGIHKIALMICLHKISDPQLRNQNPNRQSQRSQQATTARFAPPPARVEDSISTLVRPCRELREDLRRQPARKLLDAASLCIDVACSFVTQNLMSNNPPCFSCANRRASFCDGRNLA